MVDFHPHPTYWRIAGKYYDLTEFRDKHPGGSQLIDLARDRFDVYGHLGLRRNAPGAFSLNSISLLSRPSECVILQLLALHPFQKTKNAS
jgi:hypothetical protein